MNLESCVVPPLAAPPCWPFVWRHLDLFSGIGGFALACRMVGGIETVGFCEREPYAQRVLKKHWPDVPICNDIHEMKGNDYGTIDLITGGFPCQPYSLAGERRGNEDDRALWPQMLRVIREAKPTWIIGENVPGIITMALDGVLADMEEEGYACQSLCIPACGVDARHRRERVWIVAHSAKWKNDRRECGDVAKTSGRGKSVHTAINASGETLADSNSGDGHGRGRSMQMGRIGSESKAQDDGDAGRTEWLAEPNVGRVAHGVSSRVDRLCGLGNAIVPQVAAEIIAAMKRVDIGANIGIDNSDTTEGENRK